MFRTKLEVDKHVENCLKNLPSENERNQRFFSFAKLYFNIGEFEQARRYLSSYLSTKQKSAEGYHLLGKTLEKLGKKDAALEAYRTSLQLDPKQNSLVIKICELLASDDVDMDQSGARYFCEMAQSFNPHHPAVFSLKERLILTENKNPTEVSNLLLKELENRPTDVNLRVRLIRHYLQNNMINDAYKHVSKVENTDLPVFNKTLSWHEVVAEVLMKYQRDSSLSSSLNWEFWFLSVSVLDRLVTLTLDEHEGNITVSSEYVSTLLNFDQTLGKASLNVDSCPDRHLSQVFLSHYRAQLCFHLSTVVFKQAKKDLIKFKDACNMTLPVLFAAYHTPPVDLNAVWISNLPEPRLSLLKRWHREATFRCSQVGHVLYAMAKERKLATLEKASQYSTGLWREQLFKKIFITRDQQLKMNNSYFVTCPQLLELTLRLPENRELLTYDEESQLLYPDSLHHHIWITMNHKLGDVNLTAFQGLHYSVKNISACAAESICILDLQAFIFISTICAQNRVAEKKNLIPYYSSDKPPVLPASITEALCTNQQGNFFSAAYRLYKNDCTSNFGELRLLLIKGLEIVRCVGQHGLDVKLLVLLASAFSDRARKLNKQSEVESTDARAELYWKTALPLLEKLKNNQAIAQVSNRWFEYNSKDISMNEICTYIEKGKLFVGVQLQKKKEYEKALKVLETLRDPYASYYQAKIYKQMAGDITNENKENLTSEMRSQHIILLSKARDCLYLTLDRLREPSVDRSHPLNTKLGTDIENIERSLSRIDPDCMNRNECDGMSDENVSSVDSVGEHYVTGFSLGQASYMNISQRNDTLNVHSTPLRAFSKRHEARPSPERLDAQLRQLAASKDASINRILEQNRVMTDAMIEELKSFKDAVSTLTAAVDDLKSVKQGFQDLQDIKKSVDELKTSVDELQSFKNMFDMLYELKREIGEIRKEAPKQNPLSDEDLCILDNEYGGDYNLATQPTYNPNLYPANYPAARLPTVPPPNLPYGYYPGMYSPLAYPYGLNIPQPGPLSFNADQQLAADFRALTAPMTGQVLPQVTFSQHQNTPAMFPPTLTQPLSVISSNGPPIPSVSQQGNLFIRTTPTAPAFVPGSQSLLQSVSTPSVFSSTNNTLSTKAPPVNVVITSSDPLPSTITPVSQRTLSVTIPPQHLKGNTPVKSQPHNYQIPMPSSSLTNTTPSVLNKPPPAITTQSFFSNVAAPVFSVLDDGGQKNTSFGSQANKSVDKFTKNDASDLDTSNISSKSLEEHDPCPDFKPIIPLPDEVPLNTGEQDENVLFSKRAKLFRFVMNGDVKEWKERGVGILKLLHNPITGKIRVLMRREQVLKICANHFLSQDMTLTPLANSDRAYVWGAQDFADEKLVTEKFCIRFKTVDDANEFYEAFESAKKLLQSTIIVSPFAKDDKASTSFPTSISTISSAITITPVSSTNSSDSVTITPLKNTQPIDFSKKPASLGGFVFTNTPTFQPKFSLPHTKVASEPEPAKTSPFSGFSFGKQSSPNLFSNLQIVTSSSDKSLTSVSETAVAKSNTSHNKSTEDENNDDFVPTVEFKPVIPLPDLVEIKTGEENSEVLFESRAKLLRYDGSVKEWKERGIGLMKILKEDNIIRLVMRREQVHKVCCNHRLIKSMQFNKNATNPKAVTWCAQDFSEGVVRPETLTVRFKTAELADEFLKVITESQALLNENSELLDRSNSEKVSVIENQDSSTGGFGDKFKPAKGSWSCKTCYVQNDSNNKYCLACDTPQNDTVLKDSATNMMSGPKFSFGAPLAPAKIKEVSFSPSTFSTSENKDKSPAAFTFGTSPLQSSSSAKAPETITSSWGDAFKPTGWECLACYTRNDNKATKCVACTTSKENTMPKQQENKGISLGAGGQNTKTSGWGDAFKPSGWECLVCYIRNANSLTECAACSTPRESTLPKKQESKGISLDTGGQKFTFGIPSVTSQSTISTTSSSATSISGFSFIQSGVNQSSQFKFGTSTVPTNTFSPNILTTSPSTRGAGETFVFGSPQKHEFGFTPKSPRRISTGTGDEDSDGSCIEEECDNIYFKPVIPLPDRVDVKTGEEQEDVLYCHRAKLFRFVSGEWKERGLGDIKILRNKDSGKLRVVMRREQVLKICLNHMLTSDVKYIAKDEKSLLFSAADYSDGEINHQQFCIRFKSAEVAQEFEKAISDALSNEGQIKDYEKKSTDIDPDVEFISETTVSPEEEKEAVRLGLPPKFMAYRQLPKCDCEQCKKDDEYLQDSFDLRKDLSTTSVASSSLITSQLTKAVTSSSSVFGPKQTTFSFQSPLTASSSESSTLKELLSKPTEGVKSPGSSDKSIFSSPFGSSTTSLFGSPGSAGSSIFGGNKSSVSGKTTATTPSLFSSPNSTSIFSKKTGSETSTSNIFSNSGTSASIFGNSASTVPSTGSIFGSPANFSFGSAKSEPTESMKSFTFTSSPATSIFINNSNPGGTVFGKSTNFFATSAPIFGSSSAPTTKDSSFQVQEKPVFGTASDKTIFGIPSTSVLSSFDGSKATASFGSVTNTAEASGQNSVPTAEVGGGSAQSSEGKTCNLKEDDEVILKCDTGLSFASLAASSSPGVPLFAKPNSGDGDKSFAFLGAGAPVFASLQKRENKKTPKKTQGTEGGEEDGDSGNAEEDYDPHYEPIVPLPEAIVVTTGEEEETALFNERAKLYRYDDNTKEWKERGVGQMKILYHAVNGTYRFLLRREQIHKVVLNQLITPTLDLQPMSTSDKAYIWAGYNHTDDGPALEKLAIRFKNCELAGKFLAQVQGCIAQCSIEKHRSKQDSELECRAEMGQEDGLEDISGDEQDHGHSDGDAEDSDEEYARSIMVMKHCILSEEDENGEWERVGEGDIQIYYDSELYAAKIAMNDNGTGELLTNTLIGMNTKMDIIGSECIWLSVEWATDEIRWRRLKAEFPVCEDAIEFHKHYLDGLTYAQQCELIDSLPTNYEETEN